MFDWNIHLPCRKSSDLQGRLLDEFTMTSDQLISCLNHYSPSIHNAVSTGNFMIFNHSLEYESVKLLSSEFRRDFSGSLVTFLADLNSSTPFESVKKLNSSGVDAIKFHCYAQKISEKFYGVALEYSRAAEDFNMPIFIDTSYGSVDMYCYDNLKLAAFLLSEIKSVPVVLLHSGGARAMEAFLLADACPNVFLDTSFSVPYYMDSTIEKDLAFAYKRIGVERVLFGSDFPYINFEDALSKTRLFFERNGFLDSEIEIVFSNTPQKVLRGL